MRVGDIARQLNEPEHVTRYWCDQFRVPVRRSTGGQRYFDPPAQARIVEIRRLLREEGYTHSGAKRKLRA